MKKFLKLFFVFLLVFSFSFTVFAEGEEGSEGEEIVESNLVTVTPVISIKGNNNSLVLSWTGDDNATSYVISRSTDEKKGFKEVKTVTTTTYTDKKLTYGKTYYYKVKAVGATNNLKSEVVGKKVAVNKVVNVTASPASTSVKLTWDKTAPTGYYVFQSLDNKKWTKIATISKKDTTSYKVKKLKAKTTYYYRVQAFYKSGKTVVTGKKSDVVTVKTLFTLPTVKTELEGLYNFYVLVKENTKAEFYEIYTSSTEDGEYELYSTFNNDYVYEGYAYTSVNTEKPATKTYFKVRACKNKDYCSSYVKGNVKTKVSKPSIYSIKGGNKYAELRFSAYDSGSSTTFDIYRATSKDGKYTKVGTQDGATYPYVFKDTKVKNGKTYYYKLKLNVTVDEKTYTSGFSKVLSVKVGKGEEVNSAKNDAKRLNKEWYYSKSSMLNTLVESYGYTEDQAKKGVAKADIDFKTNAYKAGKEYMTYSGLFTESQMREALTYEGFTKKEIDYALNKLKINWKSRLKENINKDLVYGVSKKTLLSWYANESSGLTEAQVSGVIDSMNIDFNKQALIALKRYLKDKAGDPTFDSSTLTRTSMDYILEVEEGGFTTTEINYAITNISYNWVNEIVKDYTNRNLASQNYSESEFTAIYTDMDFTEEEIAAAIEELDIDFVNNAIAVAEAKALLEDISATNLIDYLVDDRGFTEGQAEDAIINIDFDAECVDYVNVNYVNVTGDPTKTLAEVRAELEDAGFTTANIDYAFANTDINNHVIQD